jgi:hypothetical protein
MTTNATSTTRLSWLARAGVATIAFAATTLIASTSSIARADDDTISKPGDHQQYHIELEPHMLFGFNDVYSSDGFGIGGRASIPILQNGFVPSINNSVAISFGADLLHYGGCYYTGASCSANYLFFPVALQWNFYVAHKWSAFGEAGIELYKGFFDACPGGYKCASLTEFGALPHHRLDRARRTRRVSVRDIRRLLLPMNQ